MLTPDDFAGNWSLDRLIVDHTGQMSGRLTGEARWTGRPDGRYAYTETGTFQLETGPVLKAERRYIWQWASERVVVCFDDDSPFHSFHPSGLVDGSTHLCGQDTYNVAYDFTGWPDWTATWRVTGPRKNYTSTSRYSPALLA